MCAGDRQTIIDDDLPPASVEIESDDIFAVCRRHRLAKMLVEGVNLVRKHLNMLADFGGVTKPAYLVVATFSSSDGGTQACDY